MTEDWQAGGFGLYIHWPFCEAKCPYCDFNSHVVKRIDQDVWCQAYLSEIDRVAAETRGRVLQSVFFGGGTPSLMAPGTVDRILTRIGQHWILSNEIEITLEANPSSVESRKFQEFARAGVNRISIGIQALDDEDLRRLGRLHTVNEALHALDIARQEFERVSFDLIYARQNQSLEHWESELTRALQMSPDHLSLYQLTIEQGTAFGDRYNAGHLRGLPPEDLAADMFELTQSLTGAAGLSAYEVSNHAVPDAASRHNLIYWRYGDYLGVGPGAHGRVTLDGQKYATETHLAPGAWLQAVQAGTGEKSRQALSTAEQAGEYLMMGLRIHEGLDIDRFERLASRIMDEPKLVELAKLGLIECRQGQLVLTDSGRMVLNAIVVDLLPEG